ncbi:MAG: hypothetical protein EOM76_12475 [Sphingobacteriia bacterium]|nr:hypothetical protein [Sphingobacteriia bacterium]
MKHVSLFDAISLAPLKSIAKRTLDVFRQNILKWRGLLEQMPLSKVTAIVLDESGYIAMWRLDKSVEAAGRLENLKELQNVMTGEFENLSAFIEHASLVMDTDKQAHQDLLTVMTLHASKGLEFEAVFLPGWEEGLFPHSKALDEGGQEALEEERRLAYVGLTRAKKKAMVSFASNRRVYGGWQNALPSRFIDELPEEYILMHSNRGLKGNTWSVKPSWQTYKETDEFDISNDSSSYTWGKSTGMFGSGSPKKSSDLGKRVYHEQFGTGKIISSNGDKLEISFDRFGRKKVLKRFVTEE